ncbi:MAG: winged helix-turn-helix transcriptional regulator, partial [Deltaproteobacteria bacterium]|nr:winged helix-turn-helix transcriptional regulator [Deltaproteobacteria bacterium]
TPREAARGRCIKGRDSRRTRHRARGGAHHTHGYGRGSCAGVRLQALSALSRRAAAADPRLQVGDLVLDLDALRAWRAGAELRLTAQEFKLLRVLAEHRGRVLTKARLLAAVWDLQHDPGTNLVEVYISYLRAKVDKGAARPLIHTVRGLGYLFEDKGDAG